MVTAHRHLSQTCSYLRQPMWREDFGSDYQLMGDHVLFKRFTEASFKSLLRLEYLLLP